MARNSIIVVEDEEDILDLVKYNLERVGYRVTAASSGEEGLKAIRTEIPLRQHGPGPADLRSTTRSSASS